MSNPTTRPHISFFEFVSLLALCMSLVALSIDTMLPGLSDIGESFDVTRPNSQQFVISFLFAGLAIGQLFAGPLSDSIGRKKAIYAGLALFIVGSLLSYFSPSFELMLAGRFIQGFGASAPRVVTIAMVRDRYEGRNMARVMSYIMGIFILVPAVAPSIGQLIINISNWHTIFLFFISIAIINFIWLAMRLQETLHPEDRRPFTLPSIFSGMKTVCSNRMTMCYTISSGFIFGAFLGYLNSSQQIFQVHYDVGDMFAIYFGMIALAIGAAFFVNAKLVRKFGMRYLVTASLIVMAALAMAFSVFEICVSGNVPLFVFVAYIMASAFCMGMLFGNMNTLAMIPMGHLAGIASAVIGCVSLVVAASVGAGIGQMYNGSLVPMTTGFVVLSLASLILMHFAETGDTDDDVSAITPDDKTLGAK